MTADVQKAIKQELRSIKTQQKDLEQQRKALEKALEALGGVSQNGSSGGSVAYPPHPGQQAIQDAMEVVLADLRERGGKIEKVSIEEWAGQLGVNGAALGRALEFLREQGKVKRDGVRRATHTLIGPERMTVVEPQVGVRPGRRTT